MKITGSLKWVVFFCSEKIRISQCSEHVRQDLSSQKAHFFLRQETESYVFQVSCVAEEDFESWILLLLHIECWDYSFILPYMFIWC